MNDGVRKSLLAAKIAQMQAEDAREAELSASRADARPGWGAMMRMAAGAGAAPAGVPVDQSVMAIFLEHAAESGKVRLEGPVR